MAEEISLISRVKVPGRAPDVEPKVKKRPFFVVQHASEVVVSAIDWYWYPYIPRGKLTILGGDPGQGKSFITTALAAAASRGDPFPGQEATGIVTKTLMLTGEDALDDTVVPRLQSMHADLTQIDLFDKPFVFDEEGLAGVKQMVETGGYDLIVIDPIVAYLGAKMDMNRANEVRPILRALADIASEHDAAILVVRHMRKQPAGMKSGKAIYNGMGSIDFTAAVRSELQVDEASNGDKYLNHIKANAGPKGKSIRYSITDDTFHWGPQVENIPSFKAGLISRKFRNEDKVRQWLFDLLKDHPDGMPSKDVFAMGMMEGFSQTRLEHVKLGLVISEKRGLSWFWRLDPKAPALDPDVQAVV